MNDAFSELKQLITSNSEQIGALSEVVLTKKDLDAFISRFEEVIAAKDDEIHKLHDRLAVAEGAIEQIKKSQNDSEQYSRRQSLRLHGVHRKKGESAEDCLQIVKNITEHEKLKLEIPDAVIDRAHRIGTGRDGKPPAIIFKFTTWRHRTRLYRKREDIYKLFKYKVTLDITRVNIKMMDELRKEIEGDEGAMNVVEYVFADINCQPTIRMKSERFVRFHSVKEGRAAIAKELQRVD